jgi:transcription antitermination factor NusG
MGNKKTWYAIYTKSRSEKKVYQLLRQKGIECYCPLNKVQRKWSDRLKVVEEPLFKSYVFVRISQEETIQVRMTNGVVNFVYWLDKPAVVRDTEIEMIRKFLNEYESVEATPIHIAPKSKVRIQRGILMNSEATVLKIQNNKVVVVIDSIGFSLTAYVDKSNLSVV